MPPQHAQTGGDVLDQALHAARAQTPAKVPGQTGFFRAVAGTRSPINNQSSRIPKPFATNPFLGGGAKTTVATPEQQAFLAKGNATAPHTPGPVRKQAVKIEQEFVKGADTRKVVQKTTDVGRGHTGVQGAATTAPNIAAVGQRALGLVGSGIPLGAAAPAAIAALSKLGIPTDQRQQVIGGFARDKTLSDPRAQASLVAAALARGNAIPANPNTRQLLTAALSPHEHKPSLGDIINPLNIAKDAIYTPVFAAEGGFAAGHAVRAALPKSLGGQGNTSELAALGKSVIQPYTSPSAFLTSAEVHPFQTGLQFSGLGKLAGGLAGKAAGLEALPRDVTMSNFPLQSINRGTLDANLYTRAGQKISDAALARGPKTFQKSALKNRTQGFSAEIGRNRAASDSAQFSDYAEARKGINRRRQLSLLQNEAQGLTATEREAFYKSLGEKPTRTSQAKLAGAQAKKFDKPLSEKEQRFVDTAREVAKQRTQEGIDLGRLTPEAALRRDFQPLVHVRASQGDPLATHAIAVETKIRSLRDDLAKAPADAKDPIRAQIAQANTEHDTAIQQFSQQERAKGADPFRVPFVKPKASSEFGYPGRSIRARTDVPISGMGKSRSYGDLFRSGNYTQTPEAFNRQLFETHTAADAKQFVQGVVDPKSGLGAVPVENGQALSDAVREHYVLRNRDNLRTKPKNADVSVDATDFSNQEAHALDTLKNLDEGWITNPNEMTRVPDHGDFVLVPKPVYEQVTKTVARVRPGSVEQRINQATRAYKTGVLMTRPAYPLGNLANSVGFQAPLGGAGPLSILRGVRDTIPRPPGVNDAGFIASDFGRSSVQGFHSLLDEGRPVAAITHATVGKYINTIRDLSIEADNIGRRALYAKGAMTEAKKLAGYNKLQRGFKPANAAVRDWLEHMAKGDSPEARAAAAKAMQKVTDFSGSFGDMRSTAALDLAVPFHRWTRFVIKLMLKTLPLKYPGRTLLLYQLGNIGQQGTAQQGVLPQYLQESIPLAGGLSHQFAVNTQRANPFATLGTTAPPNQVTGNPDPSQTIGNLNPFLQIGVGALTGHDLQSGRQLSNAQGQIITGNLGDMGRYTAAQLAALVPPIGALAGGTRGKADTSIPLIGEQNRKASSKPASLQQPAQPWWLPIANQILPVRVDVRNTTADQANGFKLLKAAIIKNMQAEIKSQAKTPADVARIEAKYQKLGADAQKRSAYYLKNPDALSALLASGSRSRN